MQADQFIVAQPGVEALKPVFAVGTIGGVARVTIRGDMYADGTITASKLNVAELSAITANIGVVTAGELNAQNGTMQINLNAGTIIIHGA